MASFLKASVLLLALKVAANPLPEVQERDVEATITTIVTATSSYLYTLIPPALPGVTVTAPSTYSVYTATTTATSTLTCTTTIFLPIPAATGTSPAGEIPAEIKSLMGVQPRQVTTTSTPPAPTSTPDVTVTIISGTVIVTGTTILSQRPPITRTNFQITTATNSGPLTRIDYACQATLSVYYALVTDTSTISVTRTSYPITVTTCRPAPTTPAPVTTTKPPGKRQVTSTSVAPAGRSTTTVHRISYIYATATLVASAALTVTSGVCTA